MEIKGIFKTNDNRDINVRIFSKIIELKTNLPIVSTDIDLNAKNSDVVFADRPVSIEYSADAMTDIIISKSCTVRLLTKHYLGNRLFTDNNHDIQVEIKDGDEILFSGYVQPNIYAQAYNSAYDILEILCCDNLAALQYDNFYDKLEKFPSLKGQNMTYSEMLDVIGLGLDNIYFDNSRKLKADDANNILSKVAVPSNLFIDEIPEESDTCYAVLEKYLKYLNLHIIQEGDKYFIFHTNGIDTDAHRVFSNDAGDVLNFDYSNIISKQDYLGDDTNISLDECYNQIKVECSTEKEKEPVKSPFSDDSIISPVDNKIYYGWSTLLSQDLNDRHHRDTRNLFIWNEYEHGAPYDTQKGYYDVAGNKYELDPKNYTQNAWYFRILQAKDWKFLNFYGKDVYEGVDKNTDQAKYCFSQYTDHDADGNAITRTGNYGRLCPFICGLGKSENYTEVMKDGEIVPETELKNYIVIPILGNGNTAPADQYNDTRVLAVPNVDMLEKSKMEISYTNTKAMNLTPPDDNTTNYIVFSGSIFLQGVQNFSNKYISYKFRGHIGDVALEKIGVKTEKTGVGDGDDDNVQVNILSFNNNGEHVHAPNKMDKWLVPPDCYAPKRYKFKWNEPSADGKYRGDHFSDFPILECELKIGDKWYVEYYDATNKKTWKGWYTYDECPRYIDKKDIHDATGVEKVYNHFSIGANPKRDELLIGTKFDIQNTIGEGMNLGKTKGLAIPIKKDDNVGGEFSFKILGPVNFMMTQYYVTRHPTWFRPNAEVEWGAETNMILPDVQNIFIEDFKCELFSDKGGADILGDKDLVYVSDITGGVKNEMSENFDFTTPLTTKEASELGINTDIWSTSPVIKDAGKISSFTDIYDTTKGIQDKPEKLYIDEYYKLYSVPKMILDTTLDAKHDRRWNMFTEYNFTGENDAAMQNKKFKLQAKNYDVKNNVASLSFREI